jgi:hypothetical protein
MKINIVAERTKIYSWLLIPTVGSHYSKEQGFQIAIYWLKWWACIHIPGGEK